MKEETNLEVELDTEFRTSEQYTLIIDQEEKDKK
ncbi:hypothetical protein [Butyrivibrio sp. VCB2006]